MREYSKNIKIIEQTASCFCKIALLQRIVCDFMFIYLMKVITYYVMRSSYETQLLMIVAVYSEH